jgi:NitT/TauT family transport system substrate-binding protein
MTRTVAELITAAGQGDESAMARLVERFRAMAERQAATFVPEPSLVDDAVQEAFMIAFERLADLREPEAFPGWLRQIVRRCANRHRRAAIAEPRVSDGPGELAKLPDTTTDAPDALAEQRESAAAIRRAVRSLPPAGRVAAGLFYLDGLTVAETAEVLGIPPGTVKRRLHDARGHLRGLLLSIVEPPRRRPGASPLGPAL